MQVLNRKIWKTMIIIALSQMLLICVSFVDNIMISHYDSAQVHFEAVGIGSELWYFSQAFFLCLGIVFGILYSQFKHNRKLFGDTIKFSIHATLVVVTFSSLLMFFIAPTFVSIFYHNQVGDGAAKSLAIRYIRILSIANIFATVSYMIQQPLLMTGKTKYSLYVALVALLANFVLDWIFIYVLDLGSEGAAWATVISFFLQLCTSIGIAFTKKWIYRFEGSLFKLNPHVVKLILKRWFIYVSSIFMYSSYSTVTLLLVAMYGSNMIKALTLAYMISGIMWTLLPAVKQTTNIYVGKHLGRDNFDFVKQILSQLFKIFFITNLVVTAIGLSLAFWVPNVMLNDQSLVDEARNAILVFAGANAIYMFQTYYSAILESGGKQLFPNIFNYFAPFWTAIPVILGLGPWGAGMEFAWVFAIENVSIGITVIVLWFEVRRKKWMINLSKTQEMKLAIKEK